MRIGVGRARALSKASAMLRARLRFAAKTCDDFAVARIGRAFGPDIRQQKQIGDWNQRFANAAQIFVGKNCKDQGRPFVAKNFSPGLDQSFRRDLIVRAIDDGALVPALKTCRPFDRSESSRDSTFADVDLRGTNSRDCDCRVEFLEVASEPDRRPRVRLIGKLNRRLAFSGASANYFFGRGSCGAEITGVCALMMPAFSPAISRSNRRAIFRDRDRSA